MRTSPLRVVLFATHPNSSNGYSKVAFELAKRLATHPDIQLIYYGFQNFHKNAAHEAERTLPDTVELYDAYKNEGEPKQQGFGFAQVAEFVADKKPDVCVVYNDMVVVSTILDEFKKVPEKSFKIVVYLDQVYLCQRKEHVNRLNQEADLVICFSKFWEACIKEQGLTKETVVLEHGFNPMVHYPVPRRLARLYFSLGQEDFIIVNVNRNQPRKRLDVMMMAFASFVSRHLGEPVKLLIATSPQGAWNLFEIYERELRHHGIALDQGMKHLVLLDRPQALTDEDVNVLYNAADVGINTAMGEGWGLCNFEAAAVGVPQIVPDIGGFKDFFDKDTAIMVAPKVRLYTDMTIDGCPGCAEVCDAADFADAMETYYADEHLRMSHATNARERILKDYGWADIGDKLAGYLRSVTTDHDTVDLCDLERAFGSEISCDDEEASFLAAKKNKRKRMKMVYEDDSADEDGIDVKGHTDMASTSEGEACILAKKDGPVHAQTPSNAVSRSATPAIDVAAMSAEELVSLREQLENALRVKG